MVRVSWQAAPFDIDEGAFGYDISLIGDVMGAVRRQWPIASLAGAAMALGVALQIAGIGSGAALIGLALASMGMVDRRLMLVAALVCTPSLGVFDPIVLTHVAGHVLDVRLVLTGNLAACLWIWIAVDRPRITGVTWIFLLYVVASVMLTAANQVAPLLAIPVIARNFVYLGVFIGGQAWLGSGRGAYLAIAACAAGLVGPAASGVGQWVSGGGPAAAGLVRLSGLYGSSPVGLALAMQLGVIILAASALTEDAVPRVRWLVTAALLAIMAILLAQTSSRLPFATTVATVVVFEVARRRLLGVLAVAAVSGILLISSAGLTTRLASTFLPAPTPITAGDSPGASPIDASATPATPTVTPSDEPAKDVGGGAASLRYRLFLWRTMIAKWTESPLFGYGTGSFATIFEEQSGLSRVAPHSDYLYVLLEGGILLFLLYGALQASIIVVLLARVSRGADARVPLLAVGILVANNVVNSISNALLYVDLQLIVWVIAGVALAASSNPASTARNRDDGGGSPGSRPRAATRAVRGHEAWIDSDGWDGFRASGTRLALG